MIFREECETEERKRPHQLRTHLYCWCDKESLSQYSCVSNKQISTLWHAFGDLLPPVQLSKYMDTKLGGGGGGGKEGEGQN